MKSRINICFVVLLALVSLSKTMRAGDVVGKITVGYQGWFACPNDGSPINTWWHWTKSGSNSPSLDNAGMVSWPEVSGYTTTFNTGFTNLGNGAPAAIFSSYTEQTVNTQFKWMHDKGIDCAALQRFNPNGGEGPTRDSMARKVKTAAEASGVKFYIMYDVTGWTNMQTELKTDWTNKMSAYTSSPAYAKEDGKPVVCIWGFGFSDSGRPFDAASCLEVINWFKDHGCYVIGGVPTHWRTQDQDSRANFINTYHAFNMISPWMVGRIGNMSDVDNFYNNVNLPDQADCDANGIAYQPCVLPGDLQAGQRFNGDFMWRQFYNMIRAGCQAIYISMFDEYNESNQILNTADSYLSKPTNSNFKTTSSLGTYISPDFYMHLTGEGGKMLKGIIPLSDKHSVPFQSAPIWYRSSFESGYDGLLTWKNAIDSSSNVSGYTADSNPQCEIINGSKSHLGSASIVFSGTANGGASTNCYFKAIKSNITIDSSTVLEYWLYPETENSRYVGIDFHCTDGTTLRNSGAVDQNGNSIDPAAGHGESIPLNEWSVIKCNVGSKLKGKTVDTILIAYDKPGSTGQFHGYIDDIKIIDDTMGMVITPVTGINLTPASVKVPKGAKQQLFASVIPSNATNVAVTWTSTDTSVVKVNSNGLVTAVAIGNAWVKASTQENSLSDSSFFTIISTESTPYGDIPHAIPGIIEMEDFDNGGEGVGYHDIDGTNHSDYRVSESVSVEPCSDTVSSVNGNYDIGYTNSGEWIQFTVNVETAGKYDAEMRVASLGGGTGTLDVLFGTVKKASYKIPDTKGWQVWQSVIKKGIQLDAGVQTMRVSVNGGNYNFNKIIFTKDTTPVINAVNSLHNDRGFEINPNPAYLSTTLSYNLKSAGTSIINIYNLQGKLVKSINQASQAGLQKTTLDLADLKSGIYMINIIAKDFVKTEKLIVK